MGVTSAQALNAQSTLNAAEDMSILVFSFVVKRKSRRKGHVTSAQEIQYIRE